MKIKEWEIDPVSLFSHELKTPLSSLRMGLELIQGRPKDDHHRIVRLMKEETERMIELVCGHLDQRLLKDGQAQAGQAQAGQIQNKQERPQGRPGEQAGKRPELLRFLWTPWTEAVSQALSAAKPAAEEKSLFFQINGGAWPHHKSGAPGSGRAGESEAWTAGKSQLSEGFLEVFGDPVWLAQALGNLLSNAIKASPACGGLFIDWGFSFHEGLSCSVADEGSGLSPEALNSLFKAGPPASNSFGSAPESFPPAGSLKSHGLGLSIARGIAEAHGGRLWTSPPADKKAGAKGGKKGGKPAKKREGRGAVFCLTLPVARLRLESMKPEPRPSLKPGKLKKAG